MKVTLHMAVSVDGYVAKANGDSDWVSQLDEDLFITRAREAGCIVVGKKTFEQYRGTIYPVEKVTNIVLARQPGSSTENNILFTDSAQGALALAREKGYENVLVAGGGKVSGFFLTEGLLDEILLTVHPLALGTGIKLFEGVDTEAKMELLDSEQMEDGLVQLHYKVLK